MNVGDYTSPEIAGGFFFTPGRCCMTSSIDDVMNLRAFFVILTTLTNQDMVVTYSV